MTKDGSCTVSAATTPLPKNTTATRHSPTQTTQDIRLQDLVFRKLQAEAQRKDEVCSGDGQHKKKASRKTRWRLQRRNVEEPGFATRIRITFHFVLSLSKQGSGKQQLGTAEPNARWKHVMPLLAGATSRYFMSDLRSTRGAAMQATVRGCCRLDARPKSKLDNDAPSTLSQDCQCELCRTALRNRLNLVLENVWCLVHTSA